MTSRTLLLTALTMLAFAGNSLLCRLALGTTTIDAASFTSLRLLAGALMLGLLLWSRRPRRAPSGGNLQAAALFAYAAAFSYAYVELDTATGALLLMGTVQLGMAGHGLLRGERLRPMQSLGLLLALVGLVALLLPGASAPSPRGAVLMVVAGLSWALYSILGREMVDPLASTSGNFLRALPLGLLLTTALSGRAHWDPDGASYAVLSGAMTSGLGYVLWYALLPRIGTIQAASVQLSAPVLAAMGGIVFLDETPTLRFVLVALAVLGGVALVLVGKTTGRQPPNSRPAR